MGAARRWWLLHLNNKWIMNHEIAQNFLLSSSGKMLAPEGPVARCLAARQRQNSSRGAGPRGCGLRSAWVVEGCGCASLRKTWLGAWRHRLQRWLDSPAQSPPPRCPPPPPPPPLRSQVAGPPRAGDGGSLLTTTFGSKPCATLISAVARARS